MRKLIILVLIIFVLCGCSGGGGEKPNPNNSDTPQNTDNPQSDIEQGDDFPISEMEGYWTCTKGNAYLKIYKNESGDYVFEEGNFADFSTGEIRIESVEKTAENTYYFNQTEEEIMLNDRKILEPYINKFRIIRLLNPRINFR